MVLFAFEIFSANEFCIFSSHNSKRYYQVASLFDAINKKKRCLRDKFIGVPRKITSLKDELALLEISHLSKPLCASSI